MPKMKVVESGHIYEFENLDAHLPEHRVQRISFVNREANPHPGIQTQDALRALIDRTKHCDKCLRWEGNDKIIHHLRMALALHESRAIERKAEKGLYKPEEIDTSNDGHFRLEKEEI